MTRLIVITLALGVLTGPLLPQGVVAVLGDVTTIALGVMLFCVGVDLGRNRQILACLRSQGLATLVIPLLIAVGSIGGAVIFGLLVNFPLPQAMAVGSAFGWYSLVGPMLAEVHSPKLGAIAFLANALREFISLLIIPTVAKYCGPWSAIAPSGAAAMDVTLPVVARTTSPENSILAFLSGAVLSVLVPIILPLIIQLL